MKNLSDFINNGPSITGLISDAVGGLLFDAVFKPIYDAISGFTAWLLATLGTYWMVIDVGNLLSHINHEELIKGPLAAPIALIMMFSLLIGACRIAIYRRGEELRSIILGMMAYMAVSGGGSAAVILLARGADGFAEWFITQTITQQGLGEAFFRMFALAPIAIGHQVDKAFDPSSFGVLMVFGKATGGVLGFLGGAILMALIALSSLMQLIAMIVRAGFLLTAFITLPLVAAGAVTESGMARLRRMGGWIVAVILWKPAAALVFFAANAVAKAGSDENAPLTMFVGITMMMLATMVIGPLVSLAVPWVGNMGGPTAMATVGMFSGIAAAVTPKVLRPIGNMATHAAGTAARMAGQTAAQHRQGGGQDDGPTGAPIHQLPGPSSSPSNPPATTPSSPPGPVSSATTATTASPASATANTASAGATASAGTGATAAGTTAATSGATGAGATTAAGTTAAAGAAAAGPVGLVVAGAAAVAAKQKEPSVLERMGATGASVAQGMAASAMVTAHTTAPTGAQGGSQLGADQPTPKTPPPPPPPPPVSHHASIPKGAPIPQHGHIGPTHQVAPGVASSPPPVPQPVASVQARSTQWVANSATSTPIQRATELPVAPPQTGPSPSIPLPSGSTVVPPKAV